MRFPRILPFVCLAVVTSNPVWAEVSRPEPVALPAATERPSLGEPSVKAALADTKPDDGSEAVAKSSDPAKSAEAAKSSEPAKPVRAVEPTLTAEIDLTKQRIMVSEDGDLKYTWPISSGAEEFPTPRGTFHPQWVAKMWYSKKYDNAPMPNAVFINGGVAIHATYATGMLGRPASHGCIRLAPANAATFYNLVNKHGLKMTKVSIYGTPKWRVPAVASRHDDNNGPRRTVSRVDSPPQKSWFWGDKPVYKPASAYDYGRTVYRRPPPPPGYRYADELPSRANRRYDGDRIYSNQRAPRRYDYDHYGSGW